MKNLLKRLYRLIPFKKQIFLFVRLFNPPESVFKHLHFKDLIKVKVDDKSFKMFHHGYQLENEIFWTGIKGWEKDSVELWAKLCKDAKVIFDVGANTGIYSLVAQTVNPTAKVYAFEPVERVFEKLNNNIQINNFPITAIQKALSNCDGKAIVYDTNEEHTMSVTVNKNLYKPDVETIQREIEIITLNTFIKENGVQRIDLMKIDVESHEPEVLEGFSEYIHLFKPTMLVEVLFHEVAAKLNTIFEGLDYLFYNIDAGEWADTIKARHPHYNYLVCSIETAHKLGITV